MPRGAQRGGSLGRKVGGKGSAVGRGAGINCQRVNAMLNLRTEGIIYEAVPGHT